MFTMSDDEMIWAAENKRGGASPLLRSPLWHRRQPDLPQMLLSGPEKENCTLERPWGDLLL